MDVLARAQWGLVSRSFWLWTIMSLCLTLLFHSTTTESGSSSLNFTIGKHLAISPLLGFLAAALGARLFAGDTFRPTGMYWRQLPIPQARIFWFKVACGVAVITASFLIHFLWIGTGLAQTIRLQMDSNWIDDLVGFEVWARTFGWCLLVFAISSYFAVTFARPMASMQAGVPGFLVAILAANAIGDLDSWVIATLTGLLSLLALVAAQSVWSDRGCVAGTPFEGVRRSPRRRQFPLLIAMQLILVAAPITYCVYPTEAWPCEYMGIDPWLGTALLWVVAGIVTLPWTAGQIRQSQLRVAPAALLALCNITGVGAVVWRAIRARGSARGPCWTQRVTPILAFVIVSLSLLLGGFFLGGQRYLRAWEVSVDDPEVEILHKGQLIGHGLVRGLNWGPRLGDKWGFMSRSWGDFSISREEGHSELQPTILQKKHRSGIRPLSETFSDDDLFAFRYRGMHGKFKGATAHREQKNFRIQTSLKIRGLHFPELEELADNMVARVTSADAAFEIGGDRLIRIFRTRYFSRQLPDLLNSSQAAIDTVRAERRQLRDCLDSVLKARHSSHPQQDFVAIKGPRTAPKRLLWDQPLHKYVASVYPRLRLERLRATPIPYQPETMPPHGIDGWLNTGLSPGLTGFEETAKAVRHIFATTERNAPIRLAASWALLTQDTERATPVFIELLTEHDDQSLLRVLAFTGTQRAQQELTAITAQPNDSLSQRFKGRWQEIHRLLTHCLRAIELGMTPQEFWLWDYRQRRP